MQSSFFFPLSSIHYSYHLPLHLSTYPLLLTIYILFLQSLSPPSLPSHKYNIPTFKFSPSPLVTPPTLSYQPFTTPSFFSDSTLSLHSSPITFQFSSPTHTHSPYPFYQSPIYSLYFQSLLFFSFPSSVSYFSILYCHTTVPSCTDLMRAWLRAGLR